MRTIFQPPLVPGARHKCTLLSRGVRAVIKVDAETLSLVLNPQINHQLKPLGRLCSITEQIKIPWIMIQWIQIVATLIPKSLYLVFFKLDGQPLTLEVTVIKCMITTYELITCKIVNLHIGSPQRPKQRSTIPTIQLLCP